MFLQVKPGRRLSSEQVTSIVNLVASSIPELEANQVTVVDQQGRLLSSPQGRDEFAQRDQQIEFARQTEETYSQRIEALIAPLVGAGRVRAQVSAQFDMSASEEAREQYRPESQIVRSEQLAEELSRNGAGPGGVPGALSNQPPERAVALPPGANPARPDAAGVAAGATGPENSSKQTTRNFEIDRTVAYTRQPAGRLRRLTVAVLIDNVRVVGKDDKITETALTPEQIDRITALVAKKMLSASMPSEATASTSWNPLRGAVIRRRLQQNWNRSRSGRSHGSEFREDIRRPDSCAGDHLCRPASDVAPVAGGSEASLCSAGLPGGLDQAH